MMHKVAGTPRILLAVAASLLALLVTGCASESGGDDRVIGSGPSRHNSADVQFATKMIPHHAQAVAMVNLALDRKVDPDLTSVADEMLMRQTGETTKMATWLQDWGKPVPRTMIDHVGHTMGDTSMPGALTKAEFRRLETAQGAEFERAWLEAMIAHHEGAIQMAKSEQAEGANPAAQRLATQITRTQQAELRQLRGLLSG